MGLKCPSTKSYLKLIGAGFFIFVLVFCVTTLKLAVSSRTQTVSSISMKFGMLVEVSD